MSEFTDTVVNKDAPAETRAARPAIEETIEENDTTARAAGAGDDEISEGWGDRRLPESTREKIAAMIKARTEEPGDVVAEDAPGGEAPAEAAPAEAPAEKPPAEAAPPAATAPVDTSALERLEATNRQLIAEIETLKKKPPLAARTGPDYLEDSNGWLRQRIADELGLDPTAPAVDEELAGIYSDLTAKELGVTPDTAQQAKREAARTRQLLAREKRERKASEQSKVDEEAAAVASKKAEDAATFIGNRLQTKGQDGSAFADRFPLTTELAEVVHGVKPERLLWNVIESGIQTGKLDPTASDEALIEAAAKEIETRFQVLAAKATQASTKKQSTAPPSVEKTPAAPVSERKDQRQSHGARTLTNADASVAPATPPAKKTESKADTPPKFKSNKERQDWALRHLPK